MLSRKVMCFNRKYYLGLVLYGATANDIDSVRAVAGAQFALDVGDVRGHRACGDPQAPSNLLVSQPLRNQGNDFVLSFGDELSSCHTMFIAPERLFLRCVRRGVLVRGMERAWSGGQAVTDYKRPLCNNTRSAASCLPLRRLQLEQRKGPHESSSSNDIWSG